MEYNQNSKRVEFNFQERKTMSIFREGFQLEKKSGDYMKLLKGENKFRILSGFIDGWEEWDQNRKPKRYRNKPEDAGEGCKQFVATIVWNYAEKKIQILQLTQTTIIRALESLSMDEDWGPIFFYDIKVTRTGDDKQTKYDVKPSPKKELGPEIEKAFRDKPCYLEALFTNDDPFGPWPKSTPGVFSPKDFAAPKDAKITMEQVSRLKELLSGNDDYEKTFRVKLVKAFGSDRYEDIPASQYTHIIDSIFDALDRRSIA